MRTMENKPLITEKRNAPVQRKYNRKELRRVLGGKKRGHRSMAPREIASRKILPMPENWQGWKDWKPTKKAV